MSKALNNINAQLSELYGDIVPLDTLTKHQGVTDDGIQYAIETIFENAQGLFKDTKFEFFQQKLLWNLVNAFDSTVRQIRKETGDVSSDLKACIKEQDKSDIKDYELQSLNEAIEYYVETEQVFEKALETAKNDFALYTGTAWRGYQKSDYNIHFNSASIIQATDYLKNRERAEVLSKVPQGDIVAVIGYQTVEKQQVETVLTSLHNKFEKLIFATRGHSKGLDVVTRFFARKHELSCIETQPNWKRYGKSAGFKRDDLILKLKLKGVVLFEDVLINGLDRQFVEKAKKQGLRIMVKQSPALQKLKEEFPTDKELETERQRLTDEYKAKFNK